jgi:hypothetical protein
MCFRQFKNNKIKPFALTKLHGYSNQAILSALDGSIVPEQKVRYHNQYKEDDEELTHDNCTRVGSKRNRTSKEQDRLESRSDLRNWGCGNPIAKCKSGYPKLKLRLSKKTMGIEFVMPQSKCPAPFKVNEKIELLCQDSGIRGCWFRCKVLQASQKHLKVQYEDIQDVEGSGNLEVYKFSWDLLFYTHNNYFLVVLGQTSGRIMKLPNSMLSLYRRGCMFDI